MQTFLPYKDFTKSAKALDSKRLNKQILEGYQILKVLGNPDPRAAWRNHPAVKMWRGHEFALFEYVATMVVEAQKRGIKTDKNEANLNLLWDERVDTWSPGEPYWFKKPAILRRITTTHKANLYRKDPTYYYKFHTAVTNPNNKPCCDTCQYYWVTHKETV
jgi:hypothetical protein